MTKEERAAKWDAEFIPCKNHLNKRCMRSRYVNRDRICCFCHNNSPSVLNFIHSVKGRVKLKEIQKRYERTDKGRATQARYNESYKGQLRDKWGEERKLHG